jgi:regulator of replication initiation timing
LVSWPIVLAQGGIPDVATTLFVTGLGENQMSMSTRLHGRANNFIQSGNMQDARRILMKLLALEPDNVAIWQSYQATGPTIGEYQVVLRSLARRYPNNQQIANKIADLQNRKATQQAVKTAVRSRKFALPLAVVTFITILCLVGAFLWVVLDPTHSALKKLEIEYSTLLADYQSLKTKYDNLMNDYTTLMATYQQLGAERDQLQAKNNTLLGQNNQLDYDNEQLRQDLNRTRTELNNLSAQFDDLQNRYNQLTVEYQDLNTKYVLLQNDYNGLVDRYNQLASQAIEPPYIYVQGRQVHLAFIRTNSEVVRWHVSFDDLEASIRQGYRARENLLNFITRSITLKSDSGDQYHVTDYRTFVDAEPFRTVVPDLYYSSANDDAFIYLESCDLKLC